MSGLEAGARADRPAGLGPVAGQELEVSASDPSVR
jgi:hypothetical protein